MSGSITEAQQRFITRYSDLLKELEDVLAYVSECYIKDDTDIGDRLLRDVMAGILPYDPENMTIVSIFGDDPEALEVLGHFHDAALQAAQVEKLEDTGERMHLLHEILLACYKEWYTVVTRKKADLKTSAES
ncbi:hypothetical protein CR205_15775 [Alteribacter lacisalsi]|uniref:DUF8042 domain-containing protein n=1 Tax=Alteribacter lacisalsi TaxID=2045244 RepID=A0A2W0H4A7_9BACI|nr:hypothetical protein [Alteribacter lacisalsi]PYZ95841.1 hypothetical protein CR205_15775 [Alteribacter lacisalsi]